MLCSRADPRGSTLCSRLCSRADPRASTAALALLCFAALSAACSAVLDADRKQCSSDAECVARGVASGVCVEGLCQSAMSQPVTGDGADMDAGSSSGQLGSSADAARDDTSAPGADGHDASAAEAGRSDANMDAAQEAGSLLPQDATTPCQGEGCPQCIVNADCERRGIEGGVCADSTCWPPSTQPQCSADDGCAALGPEYVGGRCLSGQCRPNPRWRCEHPPAPDGATKELSALVRDSLSLSALPGVKATLCQKLDLQCTAPVQQLTTNSDGKLVFSVPANFAGYLKIEQSDYLPAMYFLPAALPASGELQPFPLLSGGLIADALAFSLGAAGLDPRRGHMMLIAEDCMGTALPGVTFSTPQKDASTVQFYVRDLLPSTDATETADAGNGGYLNFPPGTAVIGVKQNAANLQLTTVSVAVRPGFVTVAYIRPDLR
jgi:hypothetical protein